MPWRAGRGGSGSVLDKAMPIAPRSRASVAATVSALQLLREPRVLARALSKSRRRWHHESVGIEQAPMELRVAHNRALDRRCPRLHRADVNCREPSRGIAIRPRAECPQQGRGQQHEHRACRRARGARASTILWGYGWIRILRGAAPGQDQGFLPLAGLFPGAAAAKTNHISNVAASSRGYFYSPARAVVATSSLQSSLRTYGCRRPFLPKGAHRIGRDCECLLCLITRLKRLVRW